MQRLTYRRSLSYNTTSNTRRLVKTPGNKLVYLHQKKRGVVPRCALTKVKLQGIKSSRAGKRERLCKRRRTVSRPYGGVLSCTALQEKILRAYLQEEMKNVKKFLSKKQAKK